MITSQIGCAFRNLTWFLTGHGYCNEDDIDECKVFKELISDKYSDLNLKKWKLNGVNLIGAVLSSADLREANLRKADLRGADLKETDRREADLSGTDLRGAIWCETIQENSNLGNSALYLMLLFMYKLFHRPKMDGAKYCLNIRCKTKFPEGFDPKKHNMIEVDILGNPVKKSETENNVEEN